MARYALIACVVVCCCLLAQVLPTATASAESTAINYNTGYNTFASSSAKQFRYNAALTQETVSSLKVVFSSYANQGCAIYAKVGSEPSSSSFDNSTTKIGQHSSEESSITLTLLSTGATTFFLVEFTGLSSSDSVSVSVELTSAPAVELYMGSTYSRSLSMNYRSPSKNDLYFIDVPSTFDPTVTVTMAYSGYTLGSVYVGAGYIPGLAAFDYASTNNEDDSSEKATYVTKLESGTRCFILVTEARNSYKIQPTSSVLPLPVIIGMIAAGVLLLVVCCVFGAKRQCKKAVKSDNLLVINQYGCYHITVPMAIVPTIFICVAIGVPMMRFIFLPMGCTMLGLLLLLSGHMTFEADARSGTVTVYNYRAFLCRTQKAFKMTEINHFYLKSSRTNKGQLVYRMAVAMLDGSTPNLQIAASSVSVAPRQNTMTQLNEFVKRHTPEVDRQPPQTDVHGAVNSVVVGMSSLAQQNAAMAQQLAQQQAQIAELLRQQQQQQQQQQYPQQPPSNAGGYGYPGPGAPGGGAGQAGAYTPTTPATAAATAPAQASTGVPYTPAGVPYAPSSVPYAPAGGVNGKGVDL